MIFALCSLLFLRGIFGENDLRFVDIYTNYEDTDEVLRNYRETYGSNRIYDLHIDENLPPTLGTESYLDRVDFHYPEVEFVTRTGEVVSDFGHFQDNSNEDEFVLLQSQTISPDVHNAPTRRRPKYSIPKNDRYKPIKLSYVQKIPKPTKYEESSIDENSHEDTDNTKMRIQMLLKRYLAKIYKMKYNVTTVPAVNPTSDQGSVEGDAHTKLLDSTPWWAIKNKKLNKINKLFNVFTILKFNNTQCKVTSSSGSYVGFCYTDKECQNLGGSSMGSCASGYGVCCVFRGTCGGSSSQNCTYFESPNYPDYYPADGAVIIPTTMAPPTTQNPSPTPDPRLTWYFSKSLEYAENREGYNTLRCIFNVSKANAWVNRMRIDFIDFELAGPTNGTCTVERLVISGQNSNDRVPDICGYNTGQHIYVDVSATNGPLRLSVLSTMTFRKRFKIRICQYAETCLEPTSNCLQYYTGVTGNISTFNYDQAAMFNRSVPGYFNNLNYAVCIRREAGYCSITYTNVRNGVEYPFQLRNVYAEVSTVPLGQAGAGVMDCPDDYIVIDGVRLCGDKFNDGMINANASLNAPVTDTNAGPIVIPVRTNAKVTGVGFKLFYTQNRCS